MNCNYLFIALLLPSVLLSQVDRSIQPKATEAPLINFNDSEVFQLDNGLTVILSENHKIPKVSFSIEYGSESQLEGKKIGLGNITSDLAMTGTLSRTKDQINNEIDLIGAQIGTGTKNMYLECLTKHQKKGLTILTDILMNATFPKNEFKRLMIRKSSEILSKQSDPNFMALNALLSVNFGSNHPLGEIETEATLKNITRKDVVNYYKTHYSPKGSYLVVVGDITLAQLKEVCAEYFSKWNGSVTSKTESTFVKNLTSNEVYFINKPNAVQSLITITFPLNMKSGDINQLPLNVLNGIYGGSGFAARLTQNLREKHGFTYGCYSKANVTDDGSWLSISGNFRNNVTDSAITEILAEFKKIQTELVTEEELSTLKASISGTFSRSFESPSTIAKYAYNIIKYGHSKDYYKTYLKRLNSITSSDLQAISKKYLSSGLNIIVVGNSEVVEKISRFDSDGKIKHLDTFGKEIIK